MFSFEYCKIFKSTLFEKHLRTAASRELGFSLKKNIPERIFLNLFYDYLSILHFRRHRFNLFNNLCFERKGTKEIVYINNLLSRLSSVVYLTLILALIFLTTFSLLILFLSYFEKVSECFTNSWKSLVVNINFRKDSGPHN